MWPFSKSKALIEFKKEEELRNIMKNNIEEYIIINCDAVDFPLKYKETIDELSNLYSINIHPYVDSIKHDKNIHYIKINKFKLDYLYDHFD